MNKSLLSIFLTGLILVFGGITVLPAGIEGEPSDSYFTQLFTNDLTFLSEAPALPANDSEVVVVSEITEGQEEEVSPDDHDNKDGGSFSYEGFRSFKPFTTHYYTGIWIKGLEPIRVSSGKRYITFQVFRL